MGWSFDGAYLVGQTQQARSGFDLAYMALGDKAQPARITSGAYDEMMPALSPDGRWVAYTSNESGRPEVFVADFPAAGRKWQLSQAGGSFPSWRGDGGELFFSNDREVFAVGIAERSGSLEAGVPQAPPFPKQVLRLPVRVYSSDGKRFLLQRFSGEAFTEPIRIIRSWRALVRG
jgi:hypothetical protein